MIGWEDRIIDGLGEIGIHAIVKQLNYDWNYAVFETTRRRGNFYTMVNARVNANDVEKLGARASVAEIAAQHDHEFDRTYEGRRVIADLRDHAIEATIDKVYLGGELEGYRIYVKELMAWWDESARTPKQYTCSVGELHERIKSDILVKKIIDLFEKEEKVVEHVTPCNSETSWVAEELKQMGFRVSLYPDHIRREVRIVLSKDSYHDEFIIGFNTTYKHEQMTQVLCDIMEKTTEGIHKLIDKKISRLKMQLKFGKGIDATIVKHVDESIDSYVIYATKKMFYAFYQVKTSKLLNDVDGLLSTIGDTFEKLKRPIIPGAYESIAHYKEETNNPDIYKIPARSGKTAAITKYMKDVSFTPIVAYKGYEPIDDAKLGYVKTWDEYFMVDTDAVYQMLKQATFTVGSKKEKENDSMNIAAQIKSVIFNNPAVIVMWKDGSKTIVKATNEEFDPEKGLAMAISKKVLGNDYEYYNVFKKYLKKYEKENK